jgi:uncharacterized membrane protein
MIGLGDLGYEQGANSEAYAVSGDGRVLVGYGQGPTGARAARWEDGQIEELPPLPGAEDRSIATAISDGGSVIVGICGGDACRWDAQGPVGLGRGTARGVSADGMVVVGDAPDGAFVWTAEDGMRNLQLVLSKELGLDLTGWLLEVAFAVSDDGRTIVGWGINPNGDREGWIAAVPEPTSGALALAALLGLALLRVAMAK